MARVPDILYQGQPSTNNTDLYTVGASEKATITHIIATNTNADTKYVSLHLVQNGGSVADNTAIAKSVRLVGTSDPDGGGIWTWDTPIPLNTSGDKISGIQETAGAVTVTIIGFEEAI